MRMVSCGAYEKVSDVSLKSVMNLESVMNLGSGLNLESEPNLESGLSLKINQYEMCLVARDY